MAVAEGAGRADNARNKDHGAQLTGDCDDDTSRHDTDCQGCKRIQQENGLGSAAVEPAKARYKSEEKDGDVRRTEGERVPNCSRSKISFIFARRRTNCPAEYGLVPVGLAPASATL